MQGNPAVITALNKVLTGELTSINQFFLHARLYRHQGLKQLNDHAYRKSIQDMKQADRLIERILFLEGLPNLQQLGHLKIGEHPEEMLQCDLCFLQESLPILRQAIEICEQTQDYVSRDLLEELLEDEEEYVDWLETQQSLIQALGLANYLQHMLS